MADVLLSALLSPERVRLGQRSPDWETAVRQVGEILVEAGAVEPEYVELMLERDRSVASTFVGEGVAIPHGTLAGRELVRHDALCFVQYPDGIDWQGDRVVLCIGIAARDDAHVPILARLAELLMEPERADELRRAATPEQVLDLLGDETGTSSG